MTTANSATFGSLSQPVSRFVGSGSPGRKMLMNLSICEMTQLMKPTDELNICFQMSVTPMTPATLGTKNTAR